MLYVVSPFESENIVKGISSRNIEFIRHSREENVSAKLILSRFDHRYKKYNSSDDIKVNLNNKNVDYIIINTIPYYKNISVLRMLSNFVFSFQLFFYFLFKLNRDDVVLINSIPPETILACSLLKFFRRFKLIVDVRDIWPDALVNSLGKSSFMLNMFSKYCDAVYLFSGGFVDKFIYVAPSFLSWINRYNLNGMDVIFIPLGYDEARWENIPENTENIPEFTNKINFVYVGYLSQQFDLSPVILAFKKLSKEDCCLHIIGGGVNLGTYKELASGCSQIKFYGMKDPYFISKNLYKFSVGILPLREGAASYLPNKFFDYMAASLPILAYGSPDVNQIIKDNNIGWSAKPDPCDIAVIVKQIIINTDSDCKRFFVSKLRLEYAMSSLYKKFIANVL